MGKIEFRTDGGDLAEIWVDGKRIAELCSDLHDIETAEMVAKKIAKAAGARFSKNEDL